MDAPFAEVLTTVDELRERYRQPSRLVQAKKVEHAFIHCAKSFRRGRVWEPSSWAELAAAPDACELLVSHLTLDVSPADVRANLEEGYAHDLAADTLTS
jgi:hypothetical protein